MLALCALLARGARGQAFWLPSAVVVTLPEPVRTAVALLHMARPDLVITGPVARALPTIRGLRCHCLCCHSIRMRRQLGGGACRARRARAENCALRSLDLLDSCTVFLQALQARPRRRTCNAMLVHLHAADCRARPAASGTGQT